MKTRHVSKVIDVFKRTCSCLLDMKKEIPGSHYFFLCTEQFTDTNLFTFLQDRAAVQNVHVLSIIRFVCLSLCAHIGLLYFDAAKFSIKLFSLIYFTVSVVRQREEYYSD